MYLYTESFAVWCKLFYAKKAPAQNAPELNVNRLIETTARRNRKG
jgi:hypothetical protein